MAHVDRGAGRPPPGAYGAREGLRMAGVDRRAAVELQERAPRLRPLPAQRAARPSREPLRRHDHALPQGFLRSHTGDPMKLYGFWRSLATYRVNVALALKGMKVDEEVSIDLLKGQQLNPDYRAVNPQAVVPSLVLDDGGPPLFQSLAILEYLEETQPQPPLLPKDPRGRARVRGLALISAADGHPLVVPRIRAYMEKELKLDEPTRNKWLAHWSMEALKAIESHLAKEKETGRFSHGDTPTIADICLAGQVIGATAYFKCDISGVATVKRVYDECMKIDAFSRFHPLKQPGAPSHA